MSKARRFWPKLPTYDDYFTPSKLAIEKGRLQKAFIDIRDYKTDAFGDPTTCMEEYMMHVEDVLKEIKDLL